ncbi:MAG: BlaI/MecI/CopY family transcriptional regulator [Imperialibacter sp.]|uniref:BlaI/MecI/CopY family transcriptional regulator n=1 Tax=Imperialibacter sp. TaxID=2038411 RepID=UPI003A885EA9
MKELARVEEQIMKIFWALKKGLVKDVLEKMPDPKPAYNSVLTTVRILEKKGFLSHKAYGKTHEYFPLVSKEKYTVFYLNNFLKGYFNGSFEGLVSFFVKENNLSEEEIEKLMEEAKNQQE